MINIFKKIFKQILSFICGQWIILFFILTTGLKFEFLYNNILNLSWDVQGFNYGIYLGYIGAALLFAPIYFVHKHKNKLAIILELLISCLVLTDTVYFSYFGALPTAGLLSSIGQTSDVLPAMASLMQWWFPLYFIDIVIVLISQKFIKLFINKIRKKYNLIKVKGIASLIVVIATIILCWLSLLPIGISKLSEVFERGYDTMSTSHYYGILTAHTIDAIRFANEATAHLSAEQEKTLSNWAKNNQPSQTIDNLTGSAKGKNVILIQVESLGGFVINQKINNEEITPNLNQLSKVSQFFPNDRFLFGGGHTSDTDYVVNSSYFPLPDAAVFVRYGHDNFSSLPKALIADGYSTYAYHSFNRNFWNRNVALKSLGYQKFYAADNYPKGVNINMGLNDGDFLSKTADYIKAQPKPSFSYVITLSSHVPFAITDQTKDLGISPNDYPNQVGGYLENINYTDRMIGRFFDKLRTNKLYDDSLILIYGDHTPVLPEFTAGTIKYDPNSVQEKEVPLFIKLPNEGTGKTYVNKGTHIDIMPTVLDLLGIKTNQIMFGQSLFASSNDSMKVCSDQFVTFKSTGDCVSTLSEEKLKSSTIIRYNQFNNLLKN
jgi:phosphoglycerol transferase MdoB-like AlkP superfamily enzyme